MAASVGYRLSTRQKRFVIETARWASLVVTPNGPYLGEDTNAVREQSTVNVLRSLVARGVKRFRGPRVPVRFRQFSLPFGDYDTAYPVISDR